jgi:hypothetical protein
MCWQSGKIYVRSDLIDEPDELPDDVENEEKYIAIPTKRQLDLGKPLVLEFTQELLPNDFDDVRDIFRRKGAYARFKDLLARRDALAAWHDFEAKATKRALREWCEDNSIEVIED